MILRQFDRATYYRFEITDSSLKLYSWRFFNTYKAEIPFEDIAINRFDTFGMLNSRSFNLTIVSGLVLIAVLAFNIASGSLNEHLLFISLVGASFIYFFTKWVFSQTDYYEIPTSCHGFVHVFAKKPTEKSVDQFFIYFKNHASAVLKNKYDTSDPDLPTAERIRRLRFLKNLELLSDEQQEELNELLDNSINLAGFTK